MQYGQIVLLIAICLAIYYIVMIAMDIQKATAAKALEAEDNKEEDIDISDEAKRFNSIKVTREEKPKPKPKTKEKQSDEQSAKKQDKPDGTDSKSQEDKADNGKPQESKTEEGKPQETKPQETNANADKPNRAQVEEPAQQGHLHGPNYRRPAMTNGLTVEKLVEGVEKAPENKDSKDSPLVNIMYICEVAKYKE